MLRTLLFTALVCLTGFVPSRGETFTYWIQPCSGDEASCRPSDVELATWAMQAWERESDGAVHFEKSPMSKARVRVYWANQASKGLYGEARAIDVDGRNGAEIYVLSSLPSLGARIEQAASRDALFRETVVYLTCVHEIGHALGLPHTKSNADIMYSFEFGGNIPEYFGRYRRRLKERSDIASDSGLSNDDQRRLKSLYRRETVSDAQRSNSEQ